MTEFIGEASDADLAGQALPAADDADDTDLLYTEFTANPDANDADLIEQHQHVPSPDDDYDR